MDDVMLSLSRSNGGYLHRADLLAVGLTDKAIHHAMAARLLRRIRVGTYVLRSEYDHLTPESKHTVLARSVLDKFSVGSVALSHHSAAVVHGVSVFDVALDIVHLTRLDGGSGRIESGIVHHEGRLEAREITELDGRVVVTPARAMWETACQTTQRGALTVLDSALHHGVVSLEEIEDASGRFTAWRGARAARLVSRMADGGAANPGESLFRFLCYVGRLPRPETQVSIHDRDGELVAIVDLGWWELRHVGEFDGLRKYWRDLRPGEDASQVVVREKIREDRIRALGFGMTRSTWPEVQAESTELTVARLRHDLEQSHRIFARARRHIV